VWTLGASQAFEYPGRVTLAQSNRQSPDRAGGSGTWKDFGRRCRREYGRRHFARRWAKRKQSPRMRLAKTVQDLAMVLQQRPAAGVAQQADVRIIEASAISLKRRPLEAQRENAKRDSRAQPIARGKRQFAARASGCRSKPFDRFRRLPPCCSRRASGITTFARGCSSFEQQGYKNQARPQ